MYVHIHIYTYICIYVRISTYMHAFLDILLYHPITSRKFLHRKDVPPVSHLGKKQSEANGASTRLHIQSQLLTIML